MWISSVLHEVGKHASMRLFTGYVAVLYLTMICFRTDNANNLNLLFTFQSSGKRCWSYWKSDRSDDHMVLCNVPGLTGALHRTCFLDSNIFRCSWKGASQRSGLGADGRAAISICHCARFFHACCMMFEVL